MRRAMTTLASYSLAVAVGAVLLAMIGCDVAPAEEPGPDGGLQSCELASESAVSRCERMNHFPPICIDDGCACGERVCGNERICQTWGPDDVFACRTLFWCECQS